MHKCLKCLIPISEEMAETSGMCASCAPIIEGPKPLVVDFTATQTFTPLPLKRPAPKPAAKSPSKGGKSNAVKKGKK